MKRVWWVVEVSRVRFVWKERLAELTLILLLACVPAVAPFCCLVHVDYKVQGSYIFGGTTTATLA